jgi:hypothetical protein
LEPLFFIHGVASEEMNAQAQQMNSYVGALTLLVGGRSKSATGIVALPGSEYIL